MRYTFNNCSTRTIVMTTITGFLFCTSPATAGILGSAQTFAALSGSSFTNAGVTVIKGDLGIWPGFAYTDNGTVIQTGTVYLNDAVAQTAQSDLTSAYNMLSGLPFDSSLTGQDLGAVGTLLPGVYSFTASAALTGTLTLDAQNAANAVFVFQIGSTLTTATSSAVNVINGNSGTSVYWQVGSSATLGTGTTFAGNILALSSISLNTGATITCGRALAQSGAVTFASSTVSNDCSGGGDFGSNRSDFGSFGFDGTISPVPEPSTVPLISGGLLALLLCRAVLTRRSRTVHQP